MNRKTNHPKAKRGFSVAECVVALAIVAVIAATAVSIASSSLRVTTDAYRDVAIISRCEDVIECYKSDNFEAAVAALGFSEGSYQEGGASFSYSAADGALTVTATRDGKTVCTLRYAAGGGE